MREPAGRNQPAAECAQPASALRLELGRWSQRRVQPCQGPSAELCRADIHRAVEQHLEAKAAAGVHIRLAQPARFPVGPLQHPHTRHLRQRARQSLQVPTRICAAK